MDFVKHYNIWAEPVNHDGKSQWLSLTKMTYEDATEKCKSMNEWNVMWRYEVKELTDSQSVI